MSALPDEEFHWSTEGYCQWAPDVMFPDRMYKWAVDAAKEICRDCVVLSDCVADVAAGNISEFGIKAHMTPKEQIKFAGSNAVRRIYG